MNELNDWLLEKTSKTSMIMQVHDELVFEVEENELESVEKIIVDRMVNAAELSVPLIVDTGVGLNWDEAH